MSNDMIRVGIIMAGGVGERFWPLSRRLRPKQLLHLTRTDCSMLEEAVQRIAPIVPTEDIYLVTGAHLVDPIRFEGISVPEQNILAEPMKRNTMGAIIFTTAHILAEFDAPLDQISVAVATADHRIGNTDRFQKVVSSALDMVEQEDVLGLLGIAPTRPETGYGYIEVDRTQCKTVADDVSAYSVSRFKEKPDAATAKRFMADDHHFWNSGMFFWRMSTFMQELERAHPEMVTAIYDIKKAIQNHDKDTVDRTFESIENISIDYALMEQAQHVSMVHGDFDWDDIGAWPAIERTLPQDNRGNVAVGKPILVDCDDCIVYNETGPYMAIGVLGCKDLVVVVTDDGLLVMPKDRAQEVRSIVAELKDRDMPQI